MGGGGEQLAQVPLLPAPQEVAPIAGGAMPTLLAPSTPPPAAAPTEQGGIANWLAGFGQSMVGAIPEQFGISPGRIGLNADDVTTWRANNPIGGAISELIPGLGMAVGGAKLGGAIMGRLLFRTAAAGLPTTERILTGVALQAPVLGQSPMAAGAVAGVLEMVPYELARIAGAATLGDEGSLTRITESAMLDLGLSATLFGASNWYRSTRVRDQDMLMRGIVGESYNGRAAPQENLNALYQARAGGQIAPELMPHIETNIGRLEQEIRAAAPGKGDRFVDQMWDGTSTDEMNRLFNPGASDSLRRQTFTIGEGNFATRSAWQDVAQEAQMPADWQAHVMYPRMVNAVTPEALARTQQTLARNLRTEVDGWRIAPEANSTMFVMSRELEDGRFVMFRTATPSKFIRQSIFEETADRSASYLRRVEAPLERSATEALNAGVEENVLNSTVGIQRIVTPASAEALARTGSYDAYLTSLGLRNIGKEGQELVANAWGFLKKYVATTDALFRNAPAAGALRVVMQSVYDIAAAKAATIIEGRPVFEAGKNLLTRLVRPRDGIQPILRELSEDEFSLGMRAMSEGGTMDSARAFLTNHLDDSASVERIMKLLDYTNTAGSGAAKEINLTERVFFGDTKFQPFMDNYGMSHAWTGRSRVRVLDENGKVIDVGAGRNNLEAMRNAQNSARESGGVVENKSFLSSGHKEDERLLREIMQNRGKVDATRAANTFRGGATAPPTKKEFFELFGNKVRGDYKYLADTITNEHLGPSITDMRRRYGNSVAEDLEYRQRALRGDKGSIDKFVNKTIDKVLRPWIGANSADKLVQGYNKLEFVNLVFASPAYLMQSLVQPLQTVLPGIANLVNGNAGAWQRFMDFVPAFSADGKVSGFRGMLSTMRIASASARSLARPTAAEARDLARAVAEGGISPRFIDEFAGQTSKFGQAIGEGFASGTTLAERSGNALINSMKYISTTPAAKTEEITRTYAFLAGRHVAEARGITDPEQIYQVAKRFMGRTMYSYAAADRARVFNGPAGSLAGLFKNWTFNSINDWSLYGHEAYRHGNVAPLMWALAANGALAGAGGMSIFGAADGLTKLFSDRGLMQHIYEAFGDGPNGVNMADALYFGLPGFLGVSLQNQLAAPGADPQQDVNFLFNFVGLRRAQKISTLVHYFRDEWSATGNPLASQRTWDLMSYAMGPRVLYKLFSEVEGGALRSIRDGRSITEITNPQDRWLNALGLTPTRISRAYEVSSELFQQRNEVRAMTSRLSEAFARAVDSNDQQAMSFIITRAIETGADVHSVMRGAATRTRLHNTPIVNNEFRRNPAAAPLIDALDL